MLISLAVTAKLICVFVFAYAKIRFLHDAAHLAAVQVWVGMRDGWDLSHSNKLLIDTVKFLIYKKRANEREVTNFSKGDNK